MNLTALYVLLTISLSMTAGTPLLSMVESDAVSTESNQQIVFPIQVDKFGHKLKLRSKYDDGGRSKKRFARDASLTDDDDDEEEEIYIRIQNADEDLLLQLRPNKKLQTSETVIEWVLASGVTMIKTAPDNCYLVGNSVGHAGSSLVAVSSCSGLTGFIQTNNNSYFIEPLRGNLSKYYDRNLYQRTNKYVSLTNEDLLNQTEPEDGNLGYQEHRSSQQILSLSEAHVIYKVNTILEKLNISLLNDQNFTLDSLKSSVHALNSRKKREAEVKNKKRKNNRKGRKRRHNKKKSSRKCNSLATKSQMITNEELERKIEKCQEKKARRRERNEIRRSRRMRRKNRERRRRNRRERKKKKRQEKMNVTLHSSDLSPFHRFARNLTGNQWHGGYSPDQTWELAQPAHTPAITSANFSPHEPLTPSPKRWLEVSVAVDNSVIDFHGRDETEQYIFTLFNIVSAIYQDPSLGANLEIVLLRVILYTDAKHSQVRPGEAKASLEAVNRWSSRLHHASQDALKHDMAVWITRLPLGGPSGYAPVGGVCHQDRSCTLNRDEGLTSAFIIAHEMGHVLGLTHDGDVNNNNNCPGVSGSVMAPLVAATFTSFHWSRCSKQEYHNLAQSWHCMSSPPSWLNATSVSPVVTYHYSMDDQCRVEFGEGYSVCRSFTHADSCSHLWCSNSSTPHRCKTKKGPPLEGTVCGEGKWCRFGFCISRGSAYHPIDDEADKESNSSSENLPIEKKTVQRKGNPPVRHNPQHGGWSSWSPWGPCSVTCGNGVEFRTRSCDSPESLYGGKRCRGKREEWHVCSHMKECLKPTDQRANHCRNLANMVTLDERRSKLDWLPYEPKSKRNKCRVSCFSSSTNEMFLGDENVRDGTPCSYDGPHHHLCVQGKCVALGCDLIAGSGVEEDECGVCAGDGSECSLHTESYVDTPPRAYTLVTVLPKGARHISIIEKENTTNFLALANPKLKDNQTIKEETFIEEDNVNSREYFDYQSSILLNPDEHQGPARSFLKAPSSTTLRRENRRLSQQEGLCFTMSPS